MQLLGEARDALVTFRGKNLASIPASCDTSPSAASPSRLPRPGISTGHTWMLGGSIIAHLRTCKTQIHGVKGQQLAMGPPDNGPCKHKDIFC